MDFHWKVGQIREENCSYGVYELFFSRYFRNFAPLVQFFFRGHFGREKRNLKQLACLDIILFLQEDYYWSNQPDLKVSFTAENMSRDTFVKIKKYSHVADNQNLGEGSKVAKVSFLYQVTTGMSHLHRL